MGRASTLNERILISLVENGEWEIDADGRIWRTCIRIGLRSGTNHLVRVDRRRVEKTLPHGYLQVRATIGGKRLHCGAHRLVWQHINGNIPAGHEINHDNGIKNDNRPTNLLAGTAGSNIEHAHANGLIDQFGQKNPASKLTDNQIAQIRLAYAKGGYTMLDLGERFGVRFQHISRIIRGTRRAKQGGPVVTQDLRHQPSQRDAETGRFVSAIPQVIA